MDKIEFGPIRMNIVIFKFQTVCSLEQIVISTEMIDMHTRFQEWCSSGLGTG